MMLWTMGGRDGGPKRKRGLLGVSTTLGMVLMVAGLGAQTALPAPDAPTFPSGTTVATIPYTRQEDFHHLGSLHVRLSLNGGPATGFDVDTGSVGIMVGAAEVPGFNGKGEPGEITYSSSGVHLTGVWTTVDVSFPDAKSSDGKPVVAHMQVLAVTRRDCTGQGVNAAHCTPGAASPHMLGIGFGRGHSDRFDVQEKNAFVMLNEMQAGAMRRGYTITPQGIQLGLSAETVIGGWVWQKLTPRKGVLPPPASYNGPKDYETAPGTFAVGGKQEPLGIVLVDTGLTNMMIEAPGAPVEGDVADGTPVKVGLLGGKLSYEFKVNDPANPATPRRVSWRKPTEGVYVNTGLRALALFDYCYDADGGYLGLRPRK